MLRVRAVQEKKQDHYLIVPWIFPLGISRPVQLRITLQRTASTHQTFRLLLYSRCCYNLTCLLAHQAQIPPRPQSQELTNLPSRPPPQQPRAPPLVPQPPPAPPPPPPPVMARISPTCVQFVDKCSGFMTGSPSTWPAGISQRRLSHPAR